MRTANSTLLVLLSLVALQGVSANVTHSIGIARDVDDKTIRYVEHHQYLASGEHLVMYYDEAANIIATKELTYPGLPQHPEILQSDFTRQVDVETSNRNETLLTTRRTPGRVEEFQIPLDETTIVDAGFDSFLRSNWDRFEVGVPQRYKFAVAGQGRLLAVDITKQPNSTTATTFIIKPRSFLVRWFVPEIHLRYDEDRRLAAYEGISNLNLPAGQSRTVSIEFNYFTSPPHELSQPLKEWMP